MSALIRERGLLSLSQTAYAGNVFYILTLTLSKSSMIFLLKLLTPVKLQLNIINALGVATALWGISALFVAIFECHVPKVWASFNNRCINFVSFLLHLVRDGSSDARPARILDLFRDTQHRARSNACRSACVDCVEVAHAITSQVSNRILLRSAHTVSSRIPFLESD